MKQSTQRATPTTNDHPNPYVGWVADAHGRPDDLHYLADQLRSNEPLYVVSLELDHDPPRLRLGSQEADNLQDHRAALECLDAQLRAASGALAVLRGKGPVKLWGNIEGIRPDGSRSYFLVCESGVYSLVGVAAEFYTPSDLEEPSKVERWTKVASENRFVADALGLYSAGAEWFDLWKVFEKIELDVGRDAIWRKGWSTHRRTDRFCTTTNFYRHSKNVMPTNATTLPDARRWLGDVVAEWIEYRALTPRSVRDALS